MLLGFTDPEHLGSTCRADALSGRSSVLHDNRLGTFHFFLGFAFNTIPLHQYTSIF